MIPYEIRRSLMAIQTMITVLIFIFVVMRIPPGDPAYAILGDEAPPEALEQFPEIWGLNEPLWVQFMDYLGDLLRGELGISMANRRPI